MYPFNSHWPKPILPIFGKPLLQYQIDMMKSVGIRKIYIVIGYLGYEIVRTLGTGASMDVEIEYIEQTDMLGIAHAVGRLEAHLQQPFLLCLGDIYFITDKLETLIREFHSGETRAALASKIEERPEMIRRNFAILTGNANEVTRVIEKPRYIHNKLKGCGIYLFSPEIFDAIRRTPRTAMRDEYEITESIQIMINDGLRVVHCNIIEDDLNLTIPQDLLNINLSELRRHGLRNFLCDSNGNDEGLDQCVVGKNVTLGTNLSLQNCVVFDNCNVPAATQLSNSIFTQDRVIPCEGE